MPFAAMVARHFCCALSLKSGLHKHRETDLLSSHTPFPIKVLTVAQTIGVRRKPVNTLSPPERL
jgi:hypothetical protein